MNEKPLIYTTLGNVPVEDLEYRYGWQDTEDEIAFTEQYLKNGEVVKSSTHKYLKKSPSITGEQESFV